MKIKKIIIISIMLIILLIITLNIKQEPKKEYNTKFINSTGIDFNSLSDKDE